MLLYIKDYSSIQFNLFSSSNMIQTQYQRPAFTTPPSNETALYTSVTFAIHSLELMKN
jgi:hypothetical protein